MFCHIALHATNSKGPTSRFINEKDRQYSSTGRQHLFLSLIEFSLRLDDAPPTDEFIPIGDRTTTFENSGV